MPKCIHGRRVDIRLKHKVNKSTFDASVVCPAGWTRQRFVKYVRREHPNETVRVLKWHDACPPGEWDPTLWLVNPQEMINA